MIKEKESSIRNMSLLKCFYFEDVKKKNYNFRCFTYESICTFLFIFDDDDVSFLCFISIQNINGIISLNYN